MAERGLIARLLRGSLGALLILFVLESHAHAAAFLWSKTTGTRPKAAKAPAPAKKPQGRNQSTKKPTSSSRIVASGKQTKTVSSSKGKKTTSRTRRRRAIAARPGSRIPPERVIEIQNALITRGYLQGVASGVYDDATVAAMKRFQGAENIDVTGYPTAQALRRLGLTPGPDAKSPGNFE